MRLGEIKMSADSALGPSSETSNAPEPPSASYVRNALWLLLIIYILNFLDRSIVGILAEEIRRDLSLDDWQIGIMTGLAFAFFYTVLGIPIARLADRSDRVKIISISLAVWSGFTALCGLAQNFTQMLLGRIGVGVGEAGCTPAAHSLISDYVPAERRARAIAFYGLGVPAGTLLGAVLGGVIADTWGWRTAFFVAGLPGVALAVLTWYWLKEPRRTLGFPAVKPKGEGGVMTTIKALLTSRAYVFVTFAAACAAFVSYGQGVFTSSFFQRVHGLSPGETGIWLGISSGVGGLIGTWLGGYLADKYGNKNPAAFLYVPAIGMAIASVTFTPGYLSTSWQTALMLIWIPGVLNSLWYGPAFATVQRIVPPDQRAMAVAITLFVINMVGLGLGPPFAGVLSDTLRNIMFDGSASGLTSFAVDCAKSAANTANAACVVARQDGLRWSLIIACHIGLISAALFWLGGRALRAPKLTPS
jgi:MFS transporter, Spinster family, sphingosine-1-phosphate transporter